MGEQGTIFRASAQEGVCAISASLPNAAALGRGAFEHAVSDAYVVVLRELLDRGYHPLRFWNHIPNINQDLGPGLSRYMAFNAARHAAYGKVCTAVGALPGAIATASAVGAPCDRFDTYCLATRAAGVPIENPRQVPAYEYSSRYGPVPPCFARAMLIRTPAPLLVIGGTAAVRGEDSVHQGDLSGQLEETLLNLRTLIGSGCTAAGLDLRRDALRAMVSLRAYVVDGAGAANVQDALADACGSPPSEIELRVTELCRPDLLVEIEGIALLDRVTGASSTEPA